MALVFIQIPDKWKPVDGVIRVGVKSTTELFPGLFIEQLKAQATDRYWRPTMQRLSTYLKEANGRSKSTTVSQARESESDNSTGKGFYRFVFYYITTS